MKTLRVIYHLARADFLERIRRYSFLIMLGLVVWIGYISASGQFPLLVSPNYIGITNSAWAGGLMTITVTTMLSFIGFYIVKGAVSRDYTTGVGQIMATTPLSRPVYMMGKWLSNFAVLGITILIVLLEGVVMILLSDTEGFNLVTLAAPLVIIALPCMGMVAALAVLFEAIPWLRGGFGNIAYFFLYMAYTGATSVSTLVSGSGARANPYMDVTGFQIVGESIVKAVKNAYPESAGFLSFMGGVTIQDPKYFTWNGMQWTGDLLLSRGLFLLIAVGLVVLSALFFDRFNPRNILRLRPMRVVPTSAQAVPAGEVKPLPQSRLTPLTGSHANFSFGALFLAELKLFLKGQRWWWYVIAAGLVIGQFLASLDWTRYLLIAAWVWPMLILGGLGCRENRFDTRQIVFSAPRPITNQLPATWLSAFVVTAVLGGGALIKFLMLGETVSVMGWLSGTLFIPSLALASGALTGSSKTFEVVYVVWMYVLTRKVPPLDFAGFTPQSPWYIYILLALVLVAIAGLARYRQMKARRIGR